MLRIRRLLPQDAYHLILFALPWILLALNPNWPFGNASNLDPWLYWSHARHLSGISDCQAQLLRRTLTDHPSPLTSSTISLPQSSRRSWSTSRSSIWAVYSLYYIIKVIHDRPTALLTATLLGCHAFFIGAMSWDYIDGYGITYYLLALAFLTRSWSGPQPKWWLAFAVRSFSRLLLYESGLGPLSALLSMLLRDNYLDPSGPTGVVQHYHLYEILLVWFRRLDRFLWHCHSLCARQFPGSIRPRSPLCST